MIPEVIKKAAADYISGVPGSKIVSLGKYKGADAYYVRFPDESLVGYPPVFLLLAGKVTNVLGDDALKVISYFS